GVYFKSCVWERDAIAHQRRKTSSNFNFINLFHQSIRFAQCHNNFLVMQNIIKLQFAVFSVFEPFLGGLITTNEKFPSYLRNIVKILRVVDVNFTVRLLDCARSDMLPDCARSDMLLDCARSDMLLDCARSDKTWFAYYIIAVYWVLRNVLLHFWAFQ